MTKKVNSTEPGLSIAEKANIVKEFFTYSEILAYCSVSYPTFQKVIAGKMDLLHPHTLSNLLPKIEKLYKRIEKARAALN